MNIDELLENALGSKNPFENLRSLLKELISKGYDREKLIGDLTQFHVKLMELKRESDDDLVLDMLDSLTGWCSPQMVI